MKEGNDDKNAVMVCVTRQKTCERLIRAGADMAKKMDKNLIVAHAVYAYENVMQSDNASEAMEMLYRVTNEHNGQMIVFQCEDKFSGLADCATENHVDVMILGSSPKYANQVLSIMKEKLPTMSFIVLQAEQDAIFNPPHAVLEA